MQEKKLRKMNVAFYVKKGVKYNPTSKKEVILENKTRTIEIVWAAYLLKQNLNLVIKEKTYYKKTKKKEGED